MITQGQAALVRRTAKAAFFRELRMPTSEMAFANPMVTTEMDSDQDQEEYSWLGQVPQLKRWIGLRDIKSLPTQSFTIPNLRFEATIGFENRLIKRDKLGQVVTRSRDLARRVLSHQERLMIDALLLGESTLCYDGQNFFDTDHADPSGDDQTAQSNDLAVTGTPGSITAAQFETAVDTVLQDMHTV